MLSHEWNMSKRTNRKMAMRILQRGKGLCSWGDRGGAEMLSTVGFVPRAHIVYSLKINLSTCTHIHIHTVACSSQVPYAIPRLQTFAHAGLPG